MSLNPLTYVGRFVFYGALASVVVAPMSYFIGKKKAEFDRLLEKKQPSALEKVAENQYRAINPEDGKPYRINFKESKVTPFNVRAEPEKKEEGLDSIFENEAR